MINVRFIWGKLKKIKVEIKCFINKIDSGL